jgi:hypothetical protein
MTVELANRVEELEQRARRFKLATTGMEGWENYFQNLIMQERDYFFDVMSETLAQFHRDVLDEARAAIDQALARKIRGTWTPQGKYSVNDLVAKEGGSFVARRTDPGPCPGPDWQLVSRQGARGVAGEKGERGPAGRSISSWKVDRQNSLVIPIMSDGQEGPVLDLRALFEPENTP